MNRVNRTQITLGLILIGLGLIFLLISLGIISISTWQVMIDFWPLILIFLGLNMLLKNTRGWWLVPLLVVLAIITLFVIGNPYYRSQLYDLKNPLSTEEDYAGNYSNSMELKNNVNELKAEISFGAGRLKLEQVDDRQLLYQTNLKYTGATPGVDYIYKEGLKEGQLVVDKGEEFDWINITGLADDWYLGFSSQVPLDLQIDAGAGQLDLNFKELQIEQLSINSGAADLDIILGDRDSNIKLNSGAARVKFRLPEGVGVSILMTGLISKNNFRERGLIRVSQGHYQSNNFNNADNKVRIEITSSASKIDLIYY